MTKNQHKGGGKGSNQWGPRGQPKQRSRGSGSTYQTGGLDAAVVATTQPSPPVAGSDFVLDVPYIEHADLSRNATTSVFMHPDGNGRVQVRDSEDAVSLVFGGCEAGCHPAVEVPAGEVADNGGPFCADCDSELEYQEPSYSRELTEVISAHALSQFEPEMGFKCHECGSGSQAKASVVVTDGAPSCQCSDNAMEFSGSVEIGVARDRGTSSLRRVLAKDFLAKELIEVDDVDLPDVELGYTRHWEIDDVMLGDMDDLAISFEGVDFVSGDIAHEFSSTSYPSLEDVPGFPEARADFAADREIPVGDVEVLDVNWRKGSDRLSFQFDVPEDD